LVAFVDFAPTVLSLCGVEIPRHFQRTTFIGEHTEPARRYAFAYRDRMDERYELIGAVTDGRYKYIRNFLPHLPWFHEQTRNYPRLQPIYLKWHELANTGELSGPAAIYMAPSKPREQLFDLSHDSHELENLANSPEHQESLQRLRVALRDWMVSIHDLGFMPEPQWFTRFEGLGDTRPRYSIARESPQEYPLEQIMAVADWVGQDSLETRHRQREMLASKDPATCYWAVMGLAAQPTLGTGEFDSLVAILEHPIPSCRVAAAKAILAHARRPDA
jgi:uncharacterized sulfatase